MLAIVSTFLVFVTTLGLVALYTVYRLARRNAIELDRSTEKWFRDRLKLSVYLCELGETASLNDLAVNILQWIVPGFILGATWMLSVILCILGWSGVWHST